MRTRTTIAILGMLVMTSCLQKAKESKPEEEVDDDTVVMETMSDDWVTLFDGSSFEGWHEYLGEGVSDVWKLEDGAMVFYPPKERNGKSFNIVTDKQYTDFVLSLEWKVNEASNSGIFWGVLEDAKYGQPYETGPEIQVLDNIAHPDAKAGTTHQAGALYDMIAPGKEVVKPVGEWNLCVITINHKTNQGSVRLNGENIVEFPVHGEAWNAMVAKSKFADWEGFGKYQTGKIGLQDHGDIVAYRNIQIKEL